MLVTFPVPSVEQLSCTILCTVLKCVVLGKYTECTGNIAFHVYKKYQKYVPLVSFPACMEAWCTCKVTFNIYYICEYNLFQLQFFHKENSIIIIDITLRL